VRIMMINTLYGTGSTGKIVKQIARKATERGHECFIAHRYTEKGMEEQEGTVGVSSWLDCHIHNRLAHLTMLRGCFSAVKTRRFIKKAKAFSPDVIHLNNIHGNFINLRMLFRYLKRADAKVVWTFHDCWPVTGYCKHFDMIGCDRWQEKCGSCPQKGSAIWDISSFMLKKKRKMFASVKDMTVVTPSVWLRDIVKRSYFRDHPCEVINNGIDLSVFKPTESDFRKKHGLDGKKIILGVAFDWDKRKGLDVFCDLARRLSDEYRIVIVGADERAAKMLHENITVIPRTATQRELAEIYTAADLFVNPTREENYPTVNMEALACGVPVLTYDTGGSAEIITESCGSSVAKDDIDALTSEIIRICEERPYTKEACLDRAKSFDMNERFDEYVELYESLI